MNALIKAKYFIRQSGVIVRFAWQRNMVHRFTVISFRIGEMIELLVLILMWTAIYAGGNGAIKGFSREEMITYVLVGNVCAVLTRNFLAGFVSRDINEGRLSMYLVKPISYIRFTLTHEIGRAFFATFVSFLTMILITSFFHSLFIFNTDPAYIALTILMVLLAFVTEMLISFLVGLCAFWFEEVDGIQSTVERIRRFFAGGYFPLTLLPLFLSTLSMYLPFAYSFFVPAQLYLKKMSLSEAAHGIGIQFVWILLLSLIIYVVWNRGLKKYEAIGS